MEQAIADYFQEVYGGEDHQMDDGADLALWERLERAAEASMGLYSDLDVAEAIKASNFNKGLGPDGFDGSILKPDDPSHPPTQVLSAQILGLLNKPMSIPKYLYEGRLVPLSKNKGKDQAELKDIRPIVVKSHLAKILEKG